MKRQVLLVSDCQQYAAIVEASLHDTDFRIDCRTDSCSNWGALISKQRPDVIIIATVRVDDDTLQAIRRVKKEGPVPLVLFADEGGEGSVAAAIQAGVSAYVVDGLKVERVVPILTAALTRFNELQALRQELNKLQADLRERKLIERAKGMLMKQRGCSEDDAYQVLRKLAMDQNKRLADIAEGVIDMASLMS